MIIQHLQIDDELALLYQEEAAERGLDLKDVLADRLTRAVNLDPRSRHLTIADRQLARVEEILGGGMLGSGEDLVNRVGRLARIRFGDHEIKLSAAQMLELVHRAGVNRKSVADLVQEIFDRFSVEMLNYVP